MHILVIVVMVIYYKTQGISLYGHHTNGLMLDR